MNQAISPEAKQRRGRIVMVALFAICTLPAIASYLAYYHFQPAGRTNYGELIDPQRDLNEVRVQAVSSPGALDQLDPLKIDVGKMQPLSAWRGRWVFVTAAPSSCDDACRARLFKMRQVRLTTGKDRGRVERLWLLTDSAKPDQAFLAEHKGLYTARITPAQLSRHFPGASSAQPQAHIYLMDPFGHLMMRFPSEADASKMKKDLLRLLKASRIG